MRRLAVLGLIFAGSGFAAADQNTPAPRAVQCVSVFEIMDRAAPNWMAQKNVQAAKQAWQAEAQALSNDTEVDFGTQINREMVRLADVSAQNPDITSKLALNCLAEAKT